VYDTLRLLANLCARPGAAAYLYTPHSVGIRAFCNACWADTALVFIAAGGMTLLHTVLQVCRLSGVASPRKTIAALALANNKHNGSSSSSNHA
jgi:hypothetical protein